MRIFLTYSLLALLRGRQCRCRNMWLIKVPHRKAGKHFCYRKLNFNSRGRLTVVGTNFLWATRIAFHLRYTEWWNTL